MRQGGSETPGRLCGQGFLWFLSVCLFLSGMSEHCGKRDAKIVLGHFLVEKLDFLKNT